MNQSPRAQVPPCRRDGQHQKRLEIRGRKRMKVDGLKFTDALNIERRTEIFRNVEMQVISIGVDEARAGTRRGSQQILPRSNPCILSRPTDQFLCRRPNRIGSQQDDADEEPSVSL